jgi:glucose/arabinose dehydrogenase
MKLIFPSLIAACLSSPFLFGQFKLVQVTKNLDYPTCLAATPDGRIIVTERLSGAIKVFDTKTGKVLAKPFAILPNKEKGDHSERGVLGIALDPNWPRKPYVYVLQHFTKGTQFSARLVRFTANGNVASKRTDLLLGLPSAHVHNGGTLGFGPDGKLYSAVGDFGVGKNAQDKTAKNPAGKMHRYNPDGTIPKDNPFGPGNSQFALGLRNCFGFAWHPFTRDFFVGDNGPTTTDELNILKAGKNYGWPVELGNQNKPGFEKPLRTWTPTLGPCSLTFYRGDAYPPEWVNSLWFVAHNGSVRVLKLGGKPADRVLSETILKGISFPVDAQVAADGKFYLTSHLPKGGLFRVDWTGKPPSLPDLSTQGDRVLGGKILLTHRGTEGGAVLTLIGSPISPVFTPWGFLGVQPLLVFSMGTVDSEGFLDILLNIPNLGNLRGAKVAIQTFELTPTKPARLSQTVNLQLR